MFRSGVLRAANHANAAAVNPLIRGRNILLQRDVFHAACAASGRSFSATCISYKTNSEADPPPRASRHKAGHPEASRRTSLRGAAIEAERSRASIKREATKKSKANRDADAKLVTAYSAAEQYTISAVAKILEGAGYNLDPHRTGLFPQVVHFQVGATHSDQHQRSAGDVFVFPSGTVVAWDVHDETIMDLVSNKLLPAAENPHFKNMETEDLEFTEDPESATSSIVGDKIHLGTGLRSLPDTVHPQDPHSPPQQHATDLILVKIAFASGLARSVNLAVLENSLDSYFRSTRSIPTLLSRGSRLPFTRSFILRKTGELLNARAQLNLNSELTDSLPDMFWDSRHELGLEGYFDHVGRALDVNVRSRVLNQKMDYAHQIVAVLRQQLSERHGHMLEWLIIALISVEVAFAVLKLEKDRGERGNPESTEALLRRFLEKELQDN